MDLEKIKKLQDLIDNAHKIVFFGGAGVSTESGIPDFRSVDGLYNQKYKYPPETIISHSFFKTRTEEFYDFYKEKLLILDAKPNSVHEYLSKLEKEGKLLAIVTQNIDGLHQAAGSQRVYELHGSILRNYCLKCGKSYSAKYMKDAKGIPICECGGIIKPDVVLYEEGLDSDVINGAVRAISSADLLIIGGTSLVVQPAASLIYYYKGKDIVLINKSETSQDSRASLVFHESLGDTFKRLN